MRHVKGFNGICESISKRGSSYSAGIGEYIREYVEGRPGVSKSLLMGDISDASREALLRYSASPEVGYHDGKYLNNHIHDDDMKDWVSDMDGALVWTVKRPIVLWRGWSTTQPESKAYDYFLSCTMVERVARQFAGPRGTVTAVLVKAGAKVAYPYELWKEDIEWEKKNRGSVQWSQMQETPEHRAKLRSGGIVNREAEVILPRGSKLTEIFSTTESGRTLVVARLS